MKQRKQIIYIVFITLTILLQFLSTAINFVGIPITLSLIPIIIGGAMFGTTFATTLGLTFGITVIIMVLLGLDPTGATMLQANPLITIFICLFKGTLAGFLSSIVYKSISNKKVAIISSAITATLSNTISFLIVLFFFFDTSLSYIISILLSVNFLIELLTNTILSPYLLPLINKRRHKTL